MKPTIKVVMKFNDLPGIQRAAPDEVDRRLRMVAYDGLAHVKLIMQQSPAIGNVYTRGSVTHIASAPGNPPRIDTGTLINALRVDKKRKLMYHLLDGVDYGVFLEFGLRDGTTRPFMGPTARYMARQAPSFFRDFLE